METLSDNKLSEVKHLRDPNFQAPLNYFCKAILDGAHPGSLPAETIFKGIEEFDKYTDDTVPGWEEDRYIKNQLTVMINGMRCPVRLKRKNNLYQCTVVAEGITNITGVGLSPEKVAGIFNAEIISLGALTSSLLNIEDIIIDEDKTEAFIKSINCPITFDTGTSEDGSVKEFTLGVTKSTTFDAIKDGMPYSFDNIRLLDISCNVEVKGTIDTLSGTRGDGWTIVYKLYAAPADIDKYIVSTSLSPDKALEHIRNNNMINKTLPPGDACKTIILGGAAKVSCIMSTLVNKKDVDEDAVKQLNFERAGKIIANMGSYTAALPIANLFRYKGHSAIQLTSFINHVYEENNALIYMNMHGVTIKNDHMVMVVSSYDDTYDQIVVCFTF